MNFDMYLGHGLVDDGPKPKANDDILDSCHVVTLRLNLATRHCLQSDPAKGAAQ